MKKIKKLASFVLALVMVMAMTITSFAAADVSYPKDTGDFKITLKGSQTGHIYSAYQIFKGDLLVKANGEKVLSNIEWGNGVNGGPALIQALKAKNSSAFGGLEENATAADVAKVLQDEANDSQIAQEFADVIGGALNVAINEKSGFLTTNKKDSVEGSKQGDDFVYTISGLNAGYYLVEDTAEVDGAAVSYTRYVMQVVGAVEARVKAVIPDIEKKIVMGSDRVDANTAGVGQTVHYEITGNVPDRTGYEQYFYVINDDLSDGLTFNNDITVTVGGNELATDKYHVYKGTEANGHTFQVAFLDFTNNETYPQGAEIVVSYTAEVNERAQIGNPGNLNEAQLIYSNNPNTDGNGENGEKPGTPNENVPTGESPIKRTLTFAAEINIHKINGDREALPGVEFTLYGMARDPIAANEVYYEVSEQGTFYLLKDGTYTETAPNAEVRDDNGNITLKSNEDSYVSTTVKYEKKTADKAMVGESYWVEMKATTDEKGDLVFKSLGTGTFTIEETGVPAGYNKADDMTVVINCEVPETVTSGEESATWSKGEGSSEDVNLNGETGNYNMTIINLAGSLLPSTGGIGTTIFYVLGGILVVGACVLLVVRKRMSKSE